MNLMEGSVSINGVMYGSSAAALILLGASTVSFFMGSETYIPASRTALVAGLIGIAAHSAKNRTNFEIVRDFPITSFFIGFTVGFMGALLLPQKTNEVLTLVTNGAFPNLFLTVEK